jgi:ATP/maltotriose-dependent transcriptional regulator MalT
VRLGNALVGLRSAFVDAIRHCRTALALPGVPQSLQADLLAVLSLATALDGDPEAAGDIACEAMTAARESGNAPAEALIVCVRSITDFHRGDWRTALAGAEAATRLTQRVQAPQRLWEPDIWRVPALAGVGRLDEALVIADRHQAATGACPALSRLWNATRSRLLLDAGRPADAREAARAALTATGEFGAGDLAAVTAISTLGRVAVLTGDEEALATAERDAHAMATSRSASVRTAGAWLRALIADFRGDSGGAIAILTEGTCRFDTIGPWPGGPLDVADVPWFVRVALRAGHRDRAERAAATARRRARVNPDVPLFVAAHAHARGLLLHDRDGLLRAASLFEAAQRPLARASALADAGRLD